MWYKSVLHRPSHPYVHNHSYSQFKAASTTKGKEARIRHKISRHLIFQKYGQYYRKFSTETNIFLYKKTLTEQRHLTPVLAGLTRTCIRASKVRTRR